MNLEDIILRDTRANQPDADTVAEGSLYYVTDEALTEQSRGGIWVSYSDAGVLPDFIDLGDVPSSYSGQGDKLVSVKTAEDGLEFIIPPISGITELSGDVTAGPGSGPQVASLADIPAKKKVIIFTVDGVITAGILRYIRVPWSGTITKWTLLGVPVGSVEIDIWKNTYANYPPVLADSITGASLPTIPSGDKAEDSILTGWTTGITAGDILGFKINAVNLFTWISLELEVTF